MILGPQHAVMTLALEYRLPKSWEFVLFTMGFQKPAQKWYIVDVNKKYFLNESRNTVLQIGPFLKDEYM